MLPPKTKFARRRKPISSASFHDRVDARLGDLKRRIPAHLEAAATKLHLVTGRRREVALELPAREDRGAAEARGGENRSAFRRIRATRELGRDHAPREHTRGGEEAGGASSASGTGDFGFAHDERSAWARSSR